MDSAHFDRLARIVSLALSRRTTLAALAGGIFGVGSLPSVKDADAKKRHRHRKKKKKCKGGAKKCGKKCIPTSGCCSSADCGNGTCIGNSCDCDSGFKECNGACIPQGDCCGGCPDGAICGDGECVCTQQCCDTSQCPAPQECVDGACLCPGEDAINCNARCCDGAANQVCKEDRSDPLEPQFECQAGGCPATNICSDFEMKKERFYCADDRDRFCLCTTTVDPIPLKVCIAPGSLVSDVCEACDTSSDCGTRRACVAEGPGCRCDFNFCADLCAI